MLPICPSAFNSQNVTSYSIIPRMLGSTISSLQQLKSFDGIHLTKLPAFLDELSSAGIDISKKPSLGEDYFKQSVREPYLDRLVSNLEKRFEDKCIMAAFNIFDPSKVSSNPTPEFNSLSYGNKDVEDLAKQYTGILPEAEECVEEWTSFRQYMTDNCTLLKHADVIKELCSSSSALASVYPAMSILANICRVIPIHTAEVERTFSQLKLIKTNIRNRMSEKTLDSLLRIAIEGPEVEHYPVHEAVSLWARQKNRRIF